MICLNMAMTHLLKTIIVDDEALARRGLKLRLSGRDDVEVIAEARNGREALDLIREYEPDLVFLDIQMPGMDGFGVLRELSAEDMPAVVFVTAFNDYAIKAFEANALDYLLKPIEDDRLSEALDRVAENLDQRHCAEAQESLLKLVGDITGEARWQHGRIEHQGRGRALKKKEIPKLEIKDGRPNDLDSPGRNRVD